MAGQFIRAWRRADYVQANVKLRNIPSWVPSAPPVQAVRGPFRLGAAALARPGNSDPMVTSGAVLSCSCSCGGIGSLTVVPSSRAANVKDGIPLLNISPFGVCISPANPMVAAATAAALGTLTPAPCVPVTMNWDGGSSSLQVGGANALQPSSTLRCAWSGVITIQASQY